MSQQSEITTLLKRGWVTPLDALNKCGCLNFGARIVEIRKAIAGTDFVLEPAWVEIGEKRVKAFRLKKQVVKS